MKTPKVSVIIRCFNEAHHIEKLLSELARQSYRHFEILVVDSGSTDQTVELAGKYSCRILHIERRKFSFGASLNLGCRNAQGEIICTISAHAYPSDREWLKHLIAPFSDAQIGVAYGRQRGAESTKFSEHRIFRKWFPEEAAPSANGPFCNNANCAVRRSVWKELLYDESLTGLEDIEFAQRVIQRGLKVRYVPSASVVHVHEEAWIQIFNRYRREAIALQRIYPNEHFNVGDLFRLWTSNVGSDCSEASARGLFPREAWSILKFRSAQFLGTFRGFHQRKPVDSELKRHLFYPDEP
ncbi:MAG TPA: glycosyltransferase [Bdellovibrionota bacterium]|nr:glycosyltransferase [Bdellovibrionota bacterium]